MAKNESSKNKAVKTNNENVSSVKGNTTKTKDNKKDKEIEELKKQLEEQKELFEAEQKKALEEQQKAQEKDAKNDELMAQIQAFMNGAKMGQSTVSSSSNDKSDKEYVLVTKLINGVTVKSPNEEYRAHLKFGVPTEITYEEMRELLKSPFAKKAFRKGYIEFEDEEDYKDFKLGEIKKFTEQEVIDLLSTKLDNRNEIMAKFNEWTENGKDRTLNHMLLYTIAYLCVRGDLSVSMSKAYIIKDYFKCDLQIAMDNVGMIVQF